MKTQTINELRFRKETIIELNEVQLQDVNGGTTPVCAAGAVVVKVTATSSAPCGASVGSLVTAVVDVIFDWF